VISVCVPGHLDAASRLYVNVQCPVCRGYGLEFRRVQNSMLNLLSLLMNALYAPSATSAQRAMVR
jgi:hypothetical protein